MDDKNKFQEQNASSEIKVKSETTPSLQINEELKIDFNHLRSILLNLMEMHEPILKDHGERVAKLSKRLAIAADCPEILANQIEIAALLHDIGKISLPASLISKTVPELTSSQKSQYHQHTILGSDVVKKIPGCEEIALIIRHHHETISGAGFPDNLSDDDIPLGSRIIAVANYYDHCRYPRGKDKTGGKHQAIRAMEVAADIHLDKPLVELFLEAAISKKSDSVIEITSKNLLPGMKLAYDISNVLGDALLKAETVLTETILSTFKEIERHRVEVGIKPPTGRIYIHKSSVPHNALESNIEPSTKEDLQNSHDHMTKANTSPTLPEKEKTELSSLLKKSKPHRPLIVVVDDEPHVVNALKRELRRAGYDVEGFTKALDALRYIRKNSKVYSLITDLNMPGISGDQFLVHLQKEFPALPCIVITGQATQDTVLKILKTTKITRLLPKPWNKETLLTTLKELEK